MMKKSLKVFLAVLLFSTSLWAVEFKIGGVYTAWAQSQHEFWLGKKTAGDSGFDYNDNYVVQMLRFRIEAAINDNLKAVTRFDMAQGWWGIDNIRRGVDRWGKTGASSLFDFKDTNFLFHVDQAFVAFRLNDMFAGRIGRMWYGFGHKMMVDNNYDGIQLDINNVVGKKITVSWAKVNENGDNLTDQQIGTADYRDADLYSIDIMGSNTDGSFSWNAFGFYYSDKSMADSNAFVPDGLQYFKTRFSPQISSLMALGFAAKYKVGKWTLDGEFNYLTGKDEINNTVHGAKQMWDINDGNLSGYNLYLNAKFAATDKVSVGGVLGMGSGDDDLTKGPGNVNKLRTSGFFYITEVWEDSIMPDEEGITPQGLGAPNVRAYRELENTTIVQVNTDIKIIKNLSGFLSYNYIMSTQPIYEWNVDGTPNMNGKSSTSLGQEIDFRLKVTPMEKLAFILRGGYFMPGDAAGYLINGTNKWMDSAWETKAVVLYKF
ncbi:MAG TPA: hypothetical protein EYP36_07170 [Calditrichaeota bacterium]|nr:hypothetical protein [Calditrichota bacterium]